MKIEFDGSKRPDGMSFEEYRELRKEFNMYIKNYMIGRICFVSSEMKNIGSDLVPKWVKSPAKENHTFVGDASKLRPV